MGRNKQSFSWRMLSTYRKMGRAKQRAQRYEDPPELESFEEGAVGGLVGEPELGRDDMGERLGPMLRDLIRHEMRGLGNQAPLQGCMEGRDADDDTISIATVEAPRPPREDLSVKLQQFDPQKVEWYAYRAHFLSLADQAAWTERTRATRLMGALQGSLAGVTAGLPQPVTFEALLHRVDGIYGLANARDDAALKLQNLRMEPAEGCSLFAERVRQLCARAYPTYTEIDREEQALRAFLQGLPTRNDFRMTMRVQNFITLRQAVEYGSKLEQIMKDEKGVERRHAAAPVRVVKDEEVDAIRATLRDITAELAKWRQQRADPPRQPQERRTPENSPCMICGELGHWAPTCPQRRNQRGPGAGQGQARHSTMKKSTN